VNKYQEFKVHDRFLDNAFVQPKVANQPLPPDGEADKKSTN
jgi:hypothetical protein